MTKSDDLPPSLSEPNEMKSMISELESTDSESTSDWISEWLPWLIAFGLLLIVAIIFTLGRIAIIASERKDAEKQRGDLLQHTVDDLKSRTGENQAFFETVRKLIIAQNDDERKALIDELRRFQFGELTTTTTTTSATPTPLSSSTTLAPRAPPTTTTTRPPTTTTTTTRPIPRSPPSTVVCVSTPVTQFCT